MKLALIQEKQNDLYRFKEQMWFERREVFRLQREMEEQNLEFLRQAAKEGADLALTSEAVNFPGQPFWSDVSSKKAIEETQGWFMEECATAATQGRMYLAAGMFRVKEDGRLYNSVVVFDREGRECFSYDKHFLAGNEKEYLTAGSGFPVWDSEFGRIGIGICWDMQFPETARAYALQDVDLILCPTWGWEHLYGPARAYENGIYVAAAMAVPAWKNIEGKRRPSQVIAPDGSILTEGSTDRAEIVMAEISDIKDCAAVRSMRIQDIREGRRCTGK